MKNKDYAIWVSDYFLTECFPDNWDDLSFEDLMEWIDVHKTERDENVLSSELFIEICSLAYGIKKLVDEVKSG